MIAPRLVPYGFPVAIDGARLGNVCDRPGCRADATVRETETDAIYCSETCAHRHHPDVTPGYLAIRAAAARLDWPTHYRRDLTLWDRYELAQRADGRRSPPFLWICRDYGTHLVHPDPDAARRSVPTVALVRSILTTWDPAATRCFYYDGTTLAEVSHAQAHAIAIRWDDATPTPLRRSA